MDQFDGKYKKKLNSAEFVEFVFSKYGGGIMRRRPGLGMALKFCNKSGLSNKTP